MFTKDKISQSMIDAVNSVLEKVDTEKHEVAMLSEELNESERGQKLKDAVSSLDRMMKNAEVNTQQHIIKLHKTTKVIRPKADKKYMDGLDGVRRELPPGIGDNEHFSTKVQYTPENTAISEVLDKPSAVKSYLDKSAEKRKSLAATGKLGDDSHRKISKSFHGTHKVLSREETSFSSKILEAMKPISTPDFSDVDEETMTPAQTKKKEEIVLSMKSKEKDFKKKYGKNWQNVMYATATKMAMTESADDMDVHNKRAFKNAEMKGELDEARTPVDDNVPFVTNEASKSIRNIKKIAAKHIRNLKDKQ